MPPVRRSLALCPGFSAEDPGGLVGPLACVLRVLPGLRAGLTLRTRLLYEWRAPAAATWAADGLPGAAQRELRVVIEFKSARNPAQNFRRGLLRVQLFNSSALWLKPRSGGLMFSYRAQF